MQNSPNSLFRSCLSLMLDTVAEFCIARGIHFQDFVEAGKTSFIKAAQHRLKAESGSVNTSKLSIMTGLQRPEVNRLTKKSYQPPSRDFVTRIIGQWVSDKQFADKLKGPRRLSTQGRRSEFAQLVSTVSKDLSARTVRFELERLGLVETIDGFATLKQPAYITAGDPEQTIRFGAEDARDLLKTVEENAFSGRPLPHLHARTQYDNIPDEALPEIQNWVLELGRRVHAECRNFLSTFDRDISSTPDKGNGRNRVIIGSFSHVEAVEEDA